ncbi:MAG: hypothetical protein K6G64_08820 [Eubacterium sp.]|nr:hypothetical protein [Eubacterium sp.]
MVTVKEVEEFIQSFKNKKNMKKAKIYDVIIYVMTLIVFLMQGFYVGLHHEPWADEAQAWLIADDSNSLLEIFKSTRYEGTPPLWHCIIKIAQLCGLTYDYFFILPLLFSMIGVILLFCSKAPMMWKVIVPFTYFIAYQNTVVARSYSLVFPIMMMLVISLKKKNQVLYYISLILLGLTSSYGIIISGSFLLYDLIYFTINKKIERTKTNILGFYITGAILFLAGLTVLPPDDGFSLTMAKERTITELFYDITSTFFVPMECTFLYVSTAIVLIVFFIWYCKKDILRTCICTIPLALYYILAGDCIWHLTYFYLLIIVFLILNENDSEKMSFKEGFILVMMIVQVFAGFYSSHADVQKKYCGAEKASRILKPYVEQGVEIAAADYFATAIAPYFSDNIFANRPGTQRYYLWSTESKYVDMHHKEYNSIQSLSQYSVIVAKKRTDTSLFSSLKGYRRYSCPGEMIYKFKSFKPYDFFIFIKEN